MFTAMTILLYQYSVCWRETPDATRSMDMNEYSLKEEIGAEYIPKNGLRPEKIFPQERSRGCKRGGQGSGRLCRELCYGKSRCSIGSAFIMQRTELFDQQFAGAQFQLEIKRALHEDPYGFLPGHGILLPWE
jgi:hypothetical protein